MDKYMHCLTLDAYHLYARSIAKSFVVTCGPNFSMELSKLEGELTPEMIQR